MDIRNFFGKAAAKPAATKPTAASNTPASTTTTGSARGDGDATKKQSDPAKVAVDETPPAAKSRTVIDPEDFFRDDGDFAATKKLSSTPLPAASAPAPKTVKTEAPKHTSPEKKKTSSSSSSSSPLSSPRKLPDASTRKSMPDRKHPKDDKEEGGGMAGEDYAQWSKKKRPFNPSYQQYMNRTGPKHPGSKSIPNGAPGCLAGLGFLFTGELDSLHREQAIDLVKRYGGEVKNSVSKKVSYVVVGEEAGESKMKKIQELKVKTLTEDEFLEMIRTRPGKGPAPASAAVDRDGEKAIIVLEEEKEVEKAASPGKKKATPERPEASASSPKRAKLGTAAALVTAPTTARTPAAPRVGTGRETTLFTEKFKPKTMKEIVGNKGSVDGIYQWLKDWESNRLAGFPKGSGKESLPGHRAILISGAPGTGKTTAATVCATAAGYDFIEFNASDTRSQKSMRSLIADLTANRSMTEFFSNDPKKRNLDGKPVVLIMDEVDGMSSGDRGGVGELSSIIRKTNIPIICICNDGTSPKMRTLSNNPCVFHVRWRRPEVNQIKGRMLTVAYRENLDIEGNVLAELITGTHNDIRQVLNILQMWSKTSKSMSYDDAKKVLQGGSKNVDLNPFDVIQQLLGSKYDQMDIDEIMGLYFVDYFLIPLMVQENYVHVRPSSATDEISHMELLSKAADSIAISDTIHNQVMRSQEWSLLPLQGMFSTVVPAYFTHGYANRQFQFPGWLGKNSSQTKIQRLLKEVLLHVRLRVSSDKYQLRETYLPVMRDALLYPLARQGAEAIGEVIEMMEYYYITREDVDSIGEVCGSFSPAPTIESKVKSQFTRTYNAGTHPAPFTTSSVTKVSAKVAMQNPEDEAEAEPSPEEEESDTEAAGKADDISSDKLIKSKTPKAKKDAQAAACTEASGSSKSTSSSKSSSSGGKKAAKKKTAAAAHRSNASDDDDDYY